MWIPCPRAWDPDDIDPEPMVSLMTNSEPTIGTIRVNAAEYDGRVFIERYWPWNGGLGWAPAAWDELGLPAMAGPFATIDRARLAIAAELGRAVADRIAVIREMAEVA